VLAQDKELLVFPLVSAIAASVVAAGFVLPMIGVVGFDGLERVGEGEASLGLYLWAFAFYVAQYTVIFFCNAALVGAAMIRLEGGDPTVADGFRIAKARIGPIVGYAMIAATVGMVLRAIQERSGMIGTWVAGLLGLAWTLASFMVVPVLVTRNVGPIEAVQESARLLKRTWGENVIGQAGIGLVFGLLQLLVIGIGILLGIAAAASQSVAMFFTVVAVVVLAVILVALVQAALAGIYAAALYRHASGQSAGPGFDPQLLHSAFAPKSR
jgi:hypothetical protein